MHIHILVNHGPLRAPWTLMLILSLMILKCCHSGLWLMQRLMISDFDAPLMTGRHCLKSPARISNLPPNGLSTANRSRKVRSNASKRNLSSMVASSSIISLHSLTNWARLLWAVICRVDSWEGVRGAFSLLWKVLPSDNRLAAMPVVAMAKAVDPPSIHLTALRMVFRR